MRFKTSSLTASLRSRRAEISPLRSACSAALATVPASDVRATSASVRATVVIGTVAYGVLLFLKWRGGRRIRAVAEADENEDSSGRFGGGTRDPIGGWAALNRPPLSLLIDADCMIAGVLTPQGATSQLLDVWRQGAFELVVCPQLIFEIRKALLSSRIASRYGLAPDDGEGFAKQLVEEGLLADDPQDPPRIIPDDPRDDYLVALTLASNADLLVMRDRHFEGVQVRGLLIVGPRDAINQVAASI